MEREEGRMLRLRVSQEGDRGQGDGGREAGPNAPSEGEPRG